MRSRHCSKPLLLFDFGCILVGLSRQRCIDALHKIGCGKIAYYVDECRQEDLFHELEIGGSVEAFCNEARRQSAHTDEMGVFRPCKATNEEICWAWNELLTGVPAEKLSLIRHLREDLGYRTAILSNTNQIHWEKAVRDFFTVGGLAVDDYFDHVFLSCDLGMVKPDDDIFREVLAQLGEMGQNVLFIDDSEKNCRAAERNGIRSFHDPKGNRWMTQLLPLLRGDGKAAVIGNFDGVHRGHCFVLGRLKAEAAERDLTPLAVTFDRHPRSLFQTDFHPEYLTDTAERAAMINAVLRQDGADDDANYVHELRFDREMAAMTARDFMAGVLRDQLNVRVLLLGYDNRFGRRNPDENFETYRRYGEEVGIEVLLCEPYDVGEVRVSSSSIRSMIKEGRIEEANECLGYGYHFMGTVLHGREEGRKMGFPTANILPREGRLMPPNGVYEAEVEIDADGKVRRGMTNIGTRPTFNGTGVTIETNILGFIGNLYGHNITVRLKRMLRREMAFDSPEDLRRQIEKDKAELDCNASV